MENITKGEINVFLLTVEGFTENFLSDPEVTFYADFFIKGKRSEGTTYRVYKEQMVPSKEGNTDEFLCAVETANFPEGELVCETHVEYPNSLVARTLIGKPYESTNCKIVEHR